MSPKDLSTSVLDTIEKENIQPKARWTFLLKNWVWWVLAGICLLVGSVASAVIIYLGSSGDFSLYQLGGAYKVRWLIILVPYVWILVLGLLVGLIYYNIRHTNSGYRYRPLPVITLLVVLSIVGGVLLNFLHVGRQVEHGLAFRVPFYAQNHPRYMEWLDADEGYLGGRIIEIRDEHSFILKNPSGEYTIHIEEISMPLHIGMNVFIRGELDDGVFEVEDINVLPKEVNRRPPKDQLFKKPPFQR